MSTNGEMCRVARPSGKDHGVPEEPRLHRDRYYVLAEPNPGSVVDALAASYSCAERHEGALGVYWQWNNWGGLCVAVYSYPDADEKHDPSFDSCLPYGRTGTRVRVTGPAELPTLVTSRCDREDLSCPDC